MAKNSCGCQVLAQLSRLPCKTLGRKIPKAIFSLYKKGEISAMEAVDIAGQLKNSVGKCGGSVSERRIARKSLAQVIKSIKKRK